MNWTHFSLGAAVTLDREMISALQKAQGRASPPDHSVCCHSGAAHSGCCHTYLFPVWSQNRIIVVFIKITQSVPGMQTYVPVNPTVGPGVQGQP